MTALISSINYGSPKAMKNEGYDGCHVMIIFKIKHTYLHQIQLRDLFGTSRFTATVWDKRPRIDDPV